jgi:crossover junction endodeoxyribonuclease RuvC
MRVLAIDPGYGRCGVAVLEKAGGKEKYLYSDCIETSSKAHFEERLDAVVREIEQLIVKHRPDAVALEKLFFGQNRTTALHVAEVRGAIIRSATASNIPITEYGPSEIKSATTGYGKADKKQITQMLRLLLNIEKPIRHDDEYDAIAVGVTHLAHKR